MDTVTEEKPEMQALREVIELAGSQSELARRLTSRLNRKVTQTHVWNWLNRDKKVPDWAVIPVELAVDGRVPRQRIRPDIYPLEATA